MSPINLPTLSVTLEEAIDVMAEMILGPEFAATLDIEYSKLRQKIPLRLPELVYTEDIESPGGYPCCELIAIDVADEVESGAGNLTHEVSCQWTVNGDDEQVMGREVKRYIAATRALFRNTTFLPYLGGSVWTANADFGPIVPARLIEGASGRWIKSASIEVFWKAFIR
jgi:hypothetical protein